MTPQPRRSGRPHATVDGRRARGWSSRQRLIDAMMSLIGEGDLAPSAARVAERADIGQRTVFRHFDDMDRLYAEISDTITARVMPIVLAPFTSADWRGHIREMVERRAQLFEATLPFRLAASIKRFQSPFLMGQYGRVVRLERDLLLRHLPDRVQANRNSVEALCATLSFQNWRLLRHDQGLSPEDAEAAVRYMAEALIATMDDGE